MIIKNYSTWGLIYVALVLGVGDHLGGRALKYSLLPVGFWAISLLFIRDDKNSKTIAQSLGIWFYVAIAVFAGSYLWLICSK